MQPGQTKLTADQAVRACDRIMKHTPGPWIIKDNEEDSIHSIAICAPDQDPGWWIADVHQQFTNHELAIANAKLICGAPDMLDLLLNVQRWITEPDQGGESAWALQSKIEKLLNKIGSK